MAAIGPEHGPKHGPVLEMTGFRLSWGAVLAGLVVAVALHMVLALIGIAIGLDAWEAGDAVTSLGMGLGIWTVVAGIIALFIGGLTTGRLAGILTRGDGALHGVVLWSLSTIVMAWLLASGVSTVVGGALGLVGRTASAAVGVVGQVGGQALGQAGGIDLGTLQQELEEALRQTGDPALHPDSLNRAAAQLGESATGPASTSTLAGEVWQTIQQRGGQIDRQAIANVIAARTNMSPAEADRVAGRVESLAQNVTQQAGVALDTVGAFAERTATGASEALSTAAWWTLLGMLLSLGAATAGVAVTARS